MTIVDTDREQVERMALLAKQTLVAVRDALIKAGLDRDVEPRLHPVRADSVLLQVTNPDLLRVPAPAIQNYDVPAGFLEAENDFTVRFIPHD